MITLTDMGKRYAALVGAGIVIGLGGGGWLLWRPPARVVETYAPAVRQRDSSLVLERKPDATAKPKQVMPKGATVERVVQVTVQPNALAAAVENPPRSADGKSAEKAVEKLPSVLPTPVTVDLTLVRLGDGTRRVIASSPDGVVSGGVDIPVEAARPARALAWSAGVTRDLLSGAWGGIVSRDVGFARLFAAGEPAQLGARAQVKAGVGIRF